MGLEQYNPEDQRHMPRSQQQQAMQSVPMLLNKLLHQFAVAKQSRHFGDPSTTPLIAFNKGLM